MLFPKVIEFAMYDEIYSQVEVIKITCAGQSKVDLTNLFCIESVNLIIIYY